jgi:carbonic anhydrase
MVAHLVHKGGDGALAVVAVLLDKGQDNPTLHAIWSNLPKQKEKEVAAPATIDAATLLPADKGYYTFQGSLTTPPCSEGCSLVRPETPMTLGRERAHGVRQALSDERPPDPTAERPRCRSDALTGCVQSSR